MVSRSGWSGRPGGAVTDTRTGPAAKGRVLLVDDDPDCILVCETFLADSELELRSAMTGPEGLAMVESFRPNVVVVDGMMPDIDGFELTRRLRERPEFDAIAIIMLTALTGLNDKIAGYRAGVNDYLVKPFAPEELVLRVNSFLASTDRQQLQLEREKLEILQQTATAVAHHVNSPLQTILTAADLLLEEASTDEARQQLRMIHDKAIRISELIGKLLRAYRVVSKTYVGDERMLDIEAGAAELDWPGLPDDRD